MIKINLAIFAVLKKKNWYSKQQQREFSNSKKWSLIVLGQREWVLFYFIAKNF